MHKEWRLKSLRRHSSYMIIDSYSLRSCQINGYFFAKAL